MSKDKKKKGNGAFFRLIGILMLAASIGLVMYNKLESDRAGVDSEEAITSLADEMEKLNITLKTPKTEFPGRPGTIPDMPVMEVDGNGYIGILSIPSLGIELPVMYDCDMELLTHAPCRFFGSYYTDNLVIAGHNYARHFSPIKWIDLGVEVIFTAVDGTVYRYLTDNIETVNPTELERMITGDWDLTLFTCTTGGQARCTVRCYRADLPEEAETKSGTEEEG